MNAPITNEQDRHHLQALHTLLEETHPVQLQATVRTLLFHSLSPGEGKPLTHDQLKDVEVLMGFLEKLGAVHFS